MMASISMQNSSQVDVLKSVLKLNKEIKWTKNIAKDNYIFETSNVLNDMKQN